MKKTLRLIFTPECNRSCPGCCNKDFDLPNLPRPTHFNYDEIFITGGEPLLYLAQVIGFIKAIRLVSTAKIYIYTAYQSARGASMFLDLLLYVDGITLTLHEQRDWELFQQFESATRNNPELFLEKSLRLNIFDEVIFEPEKISSHWRVKSNIVWIENCPLPENEVLMKAY